MTQGRFLTRTLLVAFACVGVVLAALARPTSATVSIANALLLMMIFVAPLGIIYRSGASRAFWIGFAVFGWGPIVIAHWIGVGWPKLFDVPARGLHALYFGAPPLTLDLGTQWQTQGPFVSPEQFAWPEEFNQFLDIAAAAGAVLLSLRGGRLAVYLYQTRQRVESAA